MNRVWGDKTNDMIIEKIEKAEKKFQDGGIYICPMCDGKCQFCDDDYQCSECELDEEKIWGQK